MFVVSLLNSINRFDLLQAISCASHVRTCVRACLDALSASYELAAEYVPMTLHGISKTFKKSEYFVMIAVDRSEFFLSSFVASS